MRKKISIISSAVLALFLTGCASDYTVDSKTKEVTLVMPTDTQNNPEITELKSSLREKYRHTMIGVIQMGDELFISFPSDLLFGVGNTQLLAHSEIYIDMFLGEVSNSKNFTYLVEGLTDSSGSQASNLALSKKRAQSVADYMESQGMSADELTVKGYGGLYAVADNKTKQERAKNRRIVITIKLKQPESAPGSEVSGENATADSGE